MKPGHLTTEFRLSIILLVADALAAYENQLPPTWAAVAGAVVAGLYSLSRGLAKQGTPGA